MRRILVLSGSPRKNGNTERLVAAFVRGAEARNTVEVVSVTDVTVHPCTGCNTCYSREGNRCVQHDDMEAICRKLEQTDVLVLASPVYFYGLSAQLKAVVDRLHTPRRNRFPIQKLGLILAGAASLPEMFDSILTQYRLILSFFRLEDAGTVLVRGAREKGEVRNGDLEKAYAFGRSIG